MLLKHISLSQFKQLYLINDPFLGSGPVPSRTSQNCNPFAAAVYVHSAVAAAASTGEVKTGPETTPSNTAADKSCLRSKCGPAAGADKVSCLPLAATKVEPRGNCSDSRTIKMSYKVTSSTKNTACSGRCLYEIIGALPQRMSLTFANGPANLKGW